MQDVDMLSHQNSETSKEQSTDHVASEFSHLAFHLCCLIQKKSQSNQEAQDSGYTLSLPELIIFLKIVFLAFGNPAYSTETKKRLVELE